MLTQCWGYQEVYVGDGTISREYYSMLHMHCNHDDCDIQTKEK